MRIACALVPRFALAVELLARPALYGLPLVLGGAPGDRAAVIECSPEAERAGIRRGMTLREARAFCHDVMIIEARPAHYRDHYEHLLDTLDAISPVVEAAEPGRAYLQIDGLTPQAPLSRQDTEEDGQQLTLDAPRTTLRPLFATEEAVAAAIIEAVMAGAQLRPRVGIAGNRFLAWAAAVSAGEPGVRVVEPNEAATFLAPLPVQWLAFDDETLRRLHWLGLRTLGDLIALPRGALAAQFGPAGERAWTLAHGGSSNEVTSDEAPLVSRQRPADLRETLDFSQPVAEVQPVLAAARQLLTRLLRRPERVGRVAHGLLCSLALSNGQRWERDLTFREPTADHERLLRALATKLDGAVFPAAAETLTLALRDLCRESGVQSSLFSARGHQLQELRAALELLHSRFGHATVMRIVGVEPWSRLPERQYALIDYEPSTSLVSARTRYG